MSTIPAQQRELADATQEAMDLYERLLGNARADLALVADARDAALRRVAELEVVPAMPEPPTPLRVLRPTTMAQLKTICTMNAEPGDLIDLGGLTFNDGGTLKVTRSGTAEHPIRFTNGTIVRSQTGPTAQVDGAHLHFAGVTFRSGSKVVQAKGQHLRFDQCTFLDARDELVKLYNGAVDVEFSQCLFSGAGQGQPDIGEALYVCEHPDKTLARVSDVRVIGCRMQNFTAEGIDMKEGALGLQVIDTVIDCTHQTGVSFAGYAGIAIKGTLVSIADVSIINPRVAAVVILASANKPLWDLPAAVLLEGVTMRSGDGRALHLVENRSTTPYLVQRDCVWQASA